MVIDLPGQLPLMTKITPERQSIYLLYKPTAHQLQLLRPYISELSTEFTCCFNYLS